MRNARIKIGYARVSTDEQSLALQRDALAAARCDQVFTDQGLSGVAARRPGLDQALTAIGAGDVLVVWRLDRLGRSLPHLIETVRQLGGKGAGFASLSEAIDTTTPGGTLVFHMMGGAGRVRVGADRREDEGRARGRQKARQGTRAAEEAHGRAGGAREGSDRGRLADTFRDG